jgi:membrane protein YqaA with SNARE-associated domain
MLNKLSLSRVRHLAEHPAAWLVLFVWSVAEALVFPIPPDVFLLPCMMLQPKKAWKMASICLVGQCLGGVVGFMLGRYAMPGLIEPFLHQVGWWPTYAAMQEPYQRWGPWLVLSAAFTPLPYKLVAPLSGAAGLALPIFVAASAVGHGLRVYLLAFACNFYGDAAVQWLKASRRHFYMAGAVVAVVGVGCLWYKLG